MDFTNSMVWILPESTDSPCIFYNMEINNQSILHMDFQFFYPCVSTSDPYQMDNSSLDKSAYPKVKNIINKKSTTHFIF